MLLRDDPGDVVVVFLEQLPELEHRSDADHRRRRAPGRVRGERGLDGAIDVVRAAERNPGEQLVRGRISHLAGRFGARVEPAAAGEDLECRRALGAGLAGERGLFLGRVHGEFLLDQGDGEVDAERAYTARACPARGFRPAPGRRSARLRPRRGAGRRVPRPSQLRRAQSARSRKSGDMCVHAKRFRRRPSEAIGIQRALAASSAATGSPRRQRAA